MSSNLEQRIDQGTGREPADLVLKGGRFFDLVSGELVAGDIAICDDRIVGTCDEYHGKQEIDVSGKVIVPGFIDAHLHIESSMVTPFEFDRCVLPRGITTAICDPHEIANVLGAEGIRYFLDCAAQTIMDVRVQLSSCVPAEERFATMPPIVTTSQNPVLMAFAAPGQEHSAVDAFSALLAEDEAENTASLSDDNVGAQEGEDGAFDPTPSEAPLPQLRSNVQPPLKPLGSARQIEGAKDDSSTKPEAKPQALAYARPDAPERGTFGQSFRNLFGGAKAGNGVAVYDISLSLIHI